MRQQHTVICVSQRVQNLRNTYQMWWPWLQWWNCPNVNTNLWTQLQKMAITSHQHTWNDTVNTFSSPVHFSQLISRWEKANYQRAFKRKTVNKNISKVVFSFCLGCKSGWSLFTTRNEHAALSFKQLTREGRERESGRRQRFDRWRKNIT